jgi:alpha,alpha-trehalase
VEWILQVAGEDAVPVYVGDDVTDEDAFWALPEAGVGIVVRGEDDDRRSAAEYVLLGPRDVRHFLLRIRERLEEDEGSPEAGS